MGANELRPQRVTLLKINDSGRIDAVVALGSVKHRMVLSTDDPELHGAIAVLCRELIRKAKEELVEQLDRDLSPSTRDALSH